MKDILKHFHELNKELKKKMYKNKAEEIFKCIPMKMETFYDKFTTECMPSTGIALKSALLTELPAFKAAPFLYSPPS